MGQHGVSLKNMGNMGNMGNMENMEHIENMEMFFGSPTEIFFGSPTEVFTKFLKSFEGKSIDKIDSKQVLRDYLNTESKLYVGNEIIIHCLLSVAVKYSVEIFLESF